MVRPTLTEGELLGFLDDGWEIVQRLSNGKLLVCIPAQVLVEMG